jgi:two-component system response regulator HydG
VGETTLRPIDVRILAATHRDLDEEVFQQRFRADRYYRLHVIDVHIPPLRERPEDLQSLASDFVATTAARQRRPGLTFAPATWDRMLHYRWPGNIRELAHAIEHACTVAAGPQIEVEDLPRQMRQAASSPLGTVAVRPLSLVEREWAEAALAQHGGRHHEAAQALGISASTLYRILHPRR